MLLYMQVSNMDVPDHVREDAEQKECAGSGTAVVEIFCCLVERGIDSFKQCNRCGAIEVDAGQVNKQIS